MEELEEKERKDGEELGEPIKIDKKAELKKKFIALIKKPRVFVVVATLVAAIMGVMFAFCKEPIKETNAYLGDACHVPFGDMIVISATELDYYSTEKEGIVYAPSYKKVIRIDGQIRNTTEKTQEIYHASFKLNKSNRDEQYVKSFFFFDNGNFNFYFSDVIIKPNASCEFSMYYLVSETYRVEDCRLIVYDAVVALINKPTEII